MITLTKLSETSLTITLGFTPVPGATGYRFTAENQAKPSHSWDPMRSSVRFQKGSAWYRVEALGVTDSGDYPSTAISAHFISDWSAGTIGYAVPSAGQPWTKPWTTLWSYTPPGYQDCGLYGSAPRQSSPDGRVSVVPNPFGSGSVLRCEIRDSDPFISTLAKAEIGSNREEPTWDGSWSDGREMWIRKDLYLGDDFGLASGAFTVVCDLHPSSNSGVPALGLGGYSQTNLQLHAGIPGQLQRKDFIALIPANRNRKLDLIIGAKIATSGGWVEAWLDGVNVIPRFSVVTAEASETGPYWKEGLYSLAAATWPGGRSVIYHGRTLIGKTKESVGA